MRKIILGIVLLLVSTSAYAQAGTRKVALIVANSSYASTSALANPANDALLVADAARRAGFEVILARDTGLASFQRSLRDFRIKADGSRVAMVYYAGHGIEGSGKNWLIPVDARLESDLDLPYEAIDLDRVMESMSGAQVRMVVLDACRNNPFGRSWRSSTRAVQRGLAGIDVDDVLVIYAAAPGQTASDGEGRNSPFATSLAKRLVEPDLPIQLLGGAVRDDVLSATGGAQRPFVSASITGTPIYLVPRAVAAQAVGVAAMQPADNATLDVLTWQGALGAQSAAAFEEYKLQFPNGRFARLADQNIARLTMPSPQVGTSAPTSASQPAFVNPNAAQIAGAPTQSFAGDGAIQKALGFGVVGMTEEFARQLSRPDSAGIAITVVDKDTDAAAKGLARGDVILSANNVPIASPQDLEAALGAAQASGRSALLLRIARGSTPARYLAVKLRNRVTRIPF